MPLLAPARSRLPVRDQFGQLSGYDQASQQSVGASQDHSGTVRTTLGQIHKEIQGSGNGLGHTLRGPKGPKVAKTGFSRVIWTNQGPVRHLEANLALLRPL